MLGYHTLVVLFIPCKLSLSACTLVLIIQLPLDGSTYQYGVFLCTCAFHRLRARIILPLLQTTHALLQTVLSWCGQSKAIADNSNYREVPFFLALYRSNLANDVMSPLGTKFWFIRSANFIENFKRIAL